MNKHSLYKAFGFSPLDIEQGEALFATFLQNDDEQRLREIVNIATEKRSPKDSGYCDLYYLHGKFPEYRKVLIINIALIANEEGRERLAWTLYSVGEAGKALEFFSPLFTAWVAEENHPQTAYWLYLGLLYRSENEALRQFLASRFKSEKALAQAAIDFLKQDRRFFLQHLQNDARDHQYCQEIWKNLQKDWPNLITGRDQRQIAKILNFPINEQEIWRDDLCFEWPLDNEAQKILGPLRQLGRDLRYHDLGEIGRDGPLAGTLTVQGKTYKGAGYRNVGAPLVYDNAGRYLCCTDWLDRYKNNLIFIDLNTGESRVLASEAHCYTPWRFYDGFFWVLVGDPSYDKPLDLKQDLLRLSPDEIEKHFKNALPKFEKNSNS